MKKKEKQLSLQSLCQEPYATQGESLTFQHLCDIRIKKYESYEYATNYYVEKQDEKSATTVIKILLLSCFTNSYYFSYQTKLSVYRHTQDLR